MPMGGTIIGFGAFIGVKLVGYSLFCRGLLRDSRQPSSPRSAWLIGGARTLMGIAFGVAYGLTIQTTGSDNAPLFYLGLLPVRAIEWALLVRLFFPARSFGDPDTWIWIAQGIVVSYALDFVAVFAAFVAPGGIWIC